MFEGSRASRPRLLPAAAGRRRVAQRIDQRRSHQLLGSRAGQRARAGAVDGIRSHGLPAAGADRGEVLESARRRAERAAAELREPAVRPGADGDARRRCFRRTIRITGRRSARSPICTRSRLDEVHAFFRRYYHPANASLALAGDIDPRRGAGAGRALLRRDRAGPSGRAGAASARRCRGDVALVLEDRVELPRLYLAWLSPAMFADGDADLDLAADLLANGKTSRLYRRLVFDERIATDVSAAQNSREIAGFFQIAATAAPGHTLGEIEAVDARGDRAARRRRPDRRRDGARPRPGGSAVRLPAADGRRLRRQVRSAERLQRVRRRSRLLRARPRALSRR